MEKKLLLWDIDGTLIWGGGGGERALLRAMKTSFGIETRLENVDYSGRTDKMIGKMLLEYHQLPASEENLHIFIESYLENLSQEISRGETRIHPGILPIINAVRERKDLLQGLLTGNMVRGARIKLTHFDLWHYFEFGAFADDSHIRNEIAPHALRRGKEKAEYEFPPEHVFVIGDTPHDIECGKIIGAKTIAVATGTYSYEQLASHAPTAVFKDLSDTAEFFAVIDF